MGRRGGSPSGETLAFLRHRDPAKDADRFRRLLEEHFRAPEDGGWFGDWAGFCFPGPVDFTGATFRGGISMRGVEFLGDVTFDDARIEADVDFTRASFAAKALFRRTTFAGTATFREAAFAGSALFGGATFEQGAKFGSAAFATESRFRSATFAGNASFGRVAFGGEAVFEVASFLGHANFGSATFARGAAFGWSTFSGEAKFGGSRFAGEADFYRARFVGPVDFGGAEIRRGLFRQIAVVSSMELDVTIPDDGVVQIREAVNDLAETAGAPGSGPLIRLGPMSVARVELHALDASRIRLRRATDIERLGLFDVGWSAPGSGDRIADEEDMRIGPDGDRPTPREVERLYRGLRKNLEDRGDRVGAHRWYVAEMEVGRRHSASAFTRYARRFYWLTSGYGLSASRAAIAFLVVVGIAFVLLMVPWSGMCPRTEAACVGWTTSLRLVVLAVSFQGVPDGVDLSGLAATAVWLFARFAGAAMLVSIGVAFRNQVAR